MEATTTINQRRILISKSNENDKEGPVIWWISRDMRIADNWAFIYSLEQARSNPEKPQKIIAAYNLVSNYLGGTERHHNFKLKILHDLREEIKNFAEQENVAIELTILENTDSESLITDLAHFINQNNASAVITDFSPLRISKQWNQYLEKNIHCPLVCVDAHNIVPCWIASQKQEYAAYTLRPKITALLPEFLEEFPVLENSTKQKRVGVFKDAQELLVTFLEEKLSEYDEKRNDAVLDAQSNLSPYLHYGVIAPQRVVLEVLAKLQKKLPLVADTATELLSTCAFLEEIIVRRELADNFCYYNEHYDSFLGFPSWAQKTLDATRNHEREFVYTKQEFEEARTHDELWNAAQHQMVATGKMHGYLRMYWAKKILQWTKNPEEAIEIAIYLNDKYELDGRDPNGYAGIAWSIGGVHDRAWFPRPVFGLVRFMARSGCEKKFNVKKYIESQNGSMSLF